MKSILRRFILPMLIALGCLPVAQLLAGAGDLPAGTAKGSFTPQDGTTAFTLTSAVAFVDVKDDNKPVLLILSDKKLPAEKWTSEFDIMEAHPKFNGLAFWFDKDGTVYRMGYYVDGEQTSVSGYFTVKLEGVFGKNLAGAVTSSDQKGSSPKADATFHVTVK